MTGSGTATDAAPPETLFLATIPGATPSKWVDRFTTRQRRVQLVNHDESGQFAHLQTDDDGAAVHPLPQLGFLRRRADISLEDHLRSGGVDPDLVHAVRLYDERPVVCVGRDHLLAAWDVDTDGPVPVTELDPKESMAPERFAPGPPVRALDSAEVPGAGERMALEIVASGVGFTLLPMSVARMFGRKDVVVLPVKTTVEAVILDDTYGLRPHEEGPDPEAHPGWTVSLAWLKSNDSELVQAFVGVSRGRRAGSSR